MRGTPLLAQIFMIYFGLGSLGINVPDFASGLLALSLNSSAYNAEIFRAGIQSISKGQMEAARSLGLSYGQSMAYVIVPQAFRFCLPPLGNEFIALLKDSSLVAIIGISDLMRVGREINGRTLRSIEVFGYVSIIYLLMTLPLSQLVAGSGAALQAPLSPSTWPPGQVLAPSFVQPQVRPFAYTFPLALAA